MKYLYKIIVLALLLSACEEKKIEFIQSNVYPSLFLLKNVPENDSLVKKEIRLFLLKYSPGKEKYSTRFYKKNTDTQYFIDNREDPGGFSSEEISMYDNETKLATFYVTKCKKDTTKYVGELYYYGVNFNLHQIDTLLYECN